MRYPNLRPPAASKKYYNDHAGSTIPVGYALFPRGGAVEKKLEFKAHALCDYGALSRVLFIS